MLAKPNMLAEALAYAARGWPVFPCNPISDAPGAKVRREKTPLVERDKDANGKPINGTGGVSKATTDAEQIRDWWNRWPDALIGVALGSKAGVWVVDFDPRGESIDDVVARYVSEVGALPAGPRSRTQSGGIHMWLLMPDGEVPKNSVKRIKGVDWRAEGGYVIAPPSRMSNGNAYSWMISPDVATMPVAPGELLDLVFRRGKWSPKQAKPVPSSHKPASGAVERYGAAALARAVENVVSAPDGRRNDTINSVALGIGHLVGAGAIAMDVAFAALRDAAYTWGIGDEDKALKPGGTLERALADGAREPQDLSHVGRREVRPRETARDWFDPNTGEELPPPAHYDGPSQDSPPDPQLDGLPFRCLGYNRETYFYFSVAKRQITPLRASQHNSLMLLQLADLNYWSQMMSVSGDLTGRQWMQVANILMQGCHRAGIFVEKRVRGRGAWMDGPQVIVHTGDSARLNGETVPLTDIPGWFIYEAEEPWEFQFGSPASNEQARMLPDIANRLTWQEKISGALLAGWCVIAPVCGALTWRPHVWITGPSKAGKSTAVKEIAGRIVGPAAIAFDGQSTEAGIRQTMGFSALPIIMDEAEAEDQTAVIRMQGILGLARVASSGGQIAKGAADGRAKMFAARSCFLFSSINTSLKHHADESRVTKLTLAKNTGKDALEHYQSLVRDIDATFTPDYAGAMFSRTVANLPTLLANIEVFKTAAAMAFGDRRAADQLGPMLAGFYLCYKTDRITLAKAEAFIAQYDWTDHVNLDSVTDEKRLLAFMMSRKIRVNVAGSGRDVSIGQAVEGCGDEREGRFYAEALAPIGIKVEFDRFFIANNSALMADLLKGTPWSSEWSRPLREIDGAERSAGAVYFAPGLTQRATVLPMGALRE